MSQTLKHSLSEWTDADVAAYYVAIALGLAPDPGGEWKFWGGKKWVFWSANPLGDGLYRILEMLTENGVIEKDGEESKYRWNPTYDWELYVGPTGPDVVTPSE
ncbi:hypothetical protein FEM03_10135 [Phragmitibacter flavus]|uniref:Uncharacterized protein n=1 Tax=Phragmitibacter flavus TaxID=2576071 RepID=A0A5R8KFB5_9BACT|nr:hypothetical protein FEM03_10135 [Phragmitibacter flavus]